MSSFWDSLGQKLYNNTLSVEEFTDLCNFLKEFDSKNNNLTTEYLQKHTCCGYVFSDYDSLLEDIKGKMISKNDLEWIISNLHTLDHSIHQTIMYTYEISKHYWKDHMQYRNSNGLMKKGIFTENTLGVGYKRF